MKIVECPRDAMQGLSSYIPVQQKADYLNLLLQVGFDTIDFGSFVSAKAIPQMRDTAEVLSKLDLSPGFSKLLAIVANKRGIDDAVSFPEIDCLGFPFSISETFQQRNTHTGIAEALRTVDYLVNECGRTGKTAVIYLSMGFGNPYGDAWSPEIAAGWTGKLIESGAGIISLADTVGIAGPAEISSVFSSMKAAYPDFEFGVHLHSNPASWKEKVAAAYEAGCRRFDSAIKGYGGCPMAGDKLTGNISTENLVSYLTQKAETLTINVDKFQKAVDNSTLVFGD